MQKAATIFYRMCLCLTLFFSCIIFFSSLTILTETQSAGRGRLDGLFYHLAVPAAFVLLAAVCLAVWRYSGAWLEKRGVSVAVALLLVAAQALFLIFISHPMYTTDTLKVHNESIAMLGRQDRWLDLESPYFQRYPNNYFITILLYYYYAVLNWCGITAFETAAVVLNIICIDVAILLTFFTVRRLRDHKLANLFLLLCFFCPTTYVWLTFVYTNTLSLPFVAGILYLAVRMRKTVPGPSKMLMGAALGACIVAGYYMRPTTLLPVIAIGLYGGMRLVRPDHTGGGVEWKKQISTGLCIVFAVVLMAAGVKLLLDHHVPDGYDDRNLPATHWVMMGLNQNSDGSFNRDDLAFSDFFPTKAEKKQANIKEIARRLSDMGLSGYAGLFVRKLDRVWAEGSDTSFQKASYAYEYPALFDLVMGRDNVGFRIYTQAFRSVTFFFICVSVLALLIRKKWHDLFVCSLSLLGCVSFFVLWEANTKYNICFIYLCLLLMADGIRQMVSVPAAIEKRWGTHRFCSGKCVTVCGWVFCLGAVCLLAVSARACVVSGNNVRYVYQTGFLNRSAWFNKRLEHGTCIRQTLQQDQQGRTEWNELKLVFQESKTPEADDHYHVTLYSMPGGSVLHESDITLDRLEESVYTISGNMEKKAGDSYYLLELTHSGRKFSMYPCMQDSGNLDMYPYGSVTIDGVSEECDLRFGMYYNRLAAGTPGISD